ncbi:hypothetical protein HPB50_003758 [Hyalomma asiaticum]|uniref:Uncharacterized protein n=1 Tax=Hyalomma asiaticum TaxID=266040 RepID=A0ACB7SEA9_HYAAI|nr:hypothetical protein HPB50_003758 [Hyalomma asiaticum]
MKVSVVTLLLCAAVFCAQLQESDPPWERHLPRRPLQQKAQEKHNDIPALDSTPEVTGTLRGKGTCQDGRCSRKPKKSITTFQPLTHARSHGSKSVATWRLGGKQLCESTFLGV